MIKSTHLNIATPLKKWCFPCLGITKLSYDEQFIVLFSKKNEGTVVSILFDSTFMVGDMASSWDMDDFEIYKGSVELHNE